MGLLPFMDSAPTASHHSLPDLSALGRLDLTPLDLTCVGRPAQPKGSSKRRPLSPLGDRSNTHTMSHRDSLPSPGPASSSASSAHALHATYSGSTGAAPPSTIHSRHSVAEVASHSTSQLPGVREEGGGAGEDNSSTSSSYKVCHMCRDGRLALF